jgi:uncharacterized cupredoxin-like copper-binding protein
MYRIKATKDGFDVDFMLPVNPGSVTPAAFTVQNFTYKYHHNYGSPVIDLEDNKVISATLLPNGKTVRLVLDGYRPGYIYEVRVAGLRAVDGTRLLHDFGYYTLNAIPGGAAAGAVEVEGAMTDARAAPKRPVTMPAAWNGEVDADLLLETEPGMKYKQNYLTVKAGSKVRFTFRNPDDMQHNFVLTSGKKADKVGQVAGTMGLKGVAKGHIPDIPEVLVHTSLVEPDTEEVIYFEAPAQPGIYEFVCTVPGHYQQMRGVLRVE